MPHLQHHDASFALALGETRVGWGGDADVRLPDGQLTRSAVVIITVSPEGTATLRPSPGDDRVLVNGVPVGREAAPLLHGDRLTIHDCELRFADEAMAGDTGEMPAVSATHVAVPSVGVLDARSRGRLVSLIDGREYPVEREGLTLGRDASCDIVIPSPTVSRRHARVEALADGGGFAIVDTSRHGVLVNDGRVSGRVALGRGDTIQIGSESFRFHAESEPSDAPKVLAEVPSLQSTAAILSVKRPAPGPAQDGVPATAPRRAGTLASLEILNPGPTRGTRFDLVAPLSHVGRGAYNDVVIGDESVSDAHAKIQSRDGAWWIVDMDSTNGSYVNGTRIYGEAPLGRDADVRFGGVKMSFRTVGGLQRLSGETRVIVGLRAPDPQRASSRPFSHPKAAGVTRTDDRPSRVPLLAGIALAAFAAIFVYLVLQGR